MHKRAEKRKEKKIEFLYKKIIIFRLHGFADSNRMSMKKIRKKLKLPLLFFIKISKKKIEDPPVRLYG
jgi:hypothetical protein